MKFPPLLIVFAGPNGAGKSTLQRYLFGDSTIPFINADVIAAQRGVDAYRAAALAEEARQELFAAGASFMFETVLSDPVGAKVAFLSRARAAGYQVEIHFVGIDSAAQSRARVIQRVGEGGHDVPDDKIRERFPRILENLHRLIGAVDVLVIYDNSSKDEPYRVLARFEGGDLIELSATLPAWIAFLGLPALATPATLSLP